MKRSLLDIISIGANDSPVQLREWDAAAPNIDYGLLLDPNGQGCCPILEGFALFTESVAELAQLQDLQALKSRAQQLFGDSGEYAQFVADKWRRPNRDAYAAFQPFNESTRALYPLVPLMREQLRPGDYILDTWCRTGWSGELLAALFPEQTIVSIWEGNQGVMGYRAFRHWLPPPRRAANLEILFHDVNRPLPFVSGSFAAVVGLDTLHRYDADNLLAECQRVCQADAPILFPHVHLTNSEPDPWFDRGCRQEHGRFWNDYLALAAAESARSVYIQSEMALFNTTPGAVVANNPLTEHYNALAGLLPEHWVGRPLGSIHGQFAVDGASYVIVNPLLYVNLGRLVVALDADSDDAVSAHIFERHPGYRAFITERLPLTLQPAQAQILYWAQKSLNINAIAGRLDMSSQQVEQQLQPLVAADVVQVLPVSVGMANLNHYFAQQEVVVPAQQQTLPGLWQRALDAFGDRVYVSSIEDELELTYAELDQLVQVTAGRLLAQLPVPGAPVVVAAEPRLETVLLFWSAQRAGRPFVAIDPGWSAARIVELVGRHGFELLFTDIDISEHGSLPAQTAVISLESAEATGTASTRFEDWLEEATSVAPPPDLPGPDATAVIMFTSGTTGIPKGVELSHHAVWQSAVNFAHYYEWSQDDVYLSLGNHATISGLRNPLLCSAVAGGRFVLPDRSVRGNALEAVSLVGNQGVTIMGVVPAFLSRLATLAPRLERASFTRLRLFLSTAASLHHDTASRVESLLGVAVRNYYGLTETCGACVFMSEPGSATANTIGRPFDAIAQLVTPAGELAAVGEPGELRIYSGNLMRGYLDEPGLTAAVMHDGWFYTGDICRWSSDRQLELLDRKRDIVKARSGALVYISEVERCLQGRFGVDELAVVGIPDDQGEDQLVCFAPAADKPSAHELQAQFNQLLRDALSPDHQLGALVYVTSLPRGANEKIRKDELLRQYHNGQGEKQL